MRWVVRAGCVLAPGLCRVRDGAGLAAPGFCDLGKLDVEACLRACAPGQLARELISRRAGACRTLERRPSANMAAMVATGSRLSNEGSRLFRIRKTCLKMLQKRGYVVDEEQLDMT